MPAIQTIVAPIAKTSDKTGSDKCSNIKSGKREVLPIDGGVAGRVAGSFDPIEFWKRMTYFEERLQTAQDHRPAAPVRPNAQGEDRDNRERKSR